MKLRQMAGNVLKLGVLGACAFGIYKWQAAGPQSSDVTAFAERACVDEIGSRYAVSNIRPISIKKSENGLVVRASVKTSRGTPAMAICLTNTHGGVRDVMIDER